MPKITILMGVSGCGKTTVGRLLSKKTGIPFFDADDFHPEINIKKMKSHEPLTDEDRRPWLVSLAKKVVDWSTENGAILACSALKESYRKLLGANTHINWVYLKGTFAVINQRMENRNHHFMKSTLLNCYKMLDYTLLLAVASGITILLILILKVRIQAFISLLISSIAVGIIAGMPPLAIIETIQQGMGSTLGFVAVVVGLGAMFGAILEQSGSAEALARYLLDKSGEKNASWALMITGFLVAIPVIFDVAFIILVPLIYSLQRTTKKSLLLY